MTTNLFKEHVTDVLNKKCQAEGRGAFLLAGTVHTFIAMCTKVQGVPGITQWVL
jgi:hypothetical protein